MTETAGYLHCDSRRLLAGGCFGLEYFRRTVTAGHGRIRPVETRMKYAPVLMLKPRGSVLRSLNSKPRTTLYGHIESVSFRGPARQ